MCLIGCPDERLAAVADRYDYKQPLDPRKVQERMEQEGGRKGFWGTLYSTKKWEEAQMVLQHASGNVAASKKISMADYYQKMEPRSDRTPFQDLFAAYEASPVDLPDTEETEDLRPLYKTNAKGEAFDTLDRKRLIEIVLEMPKEQAPGCFMGAGLDIKNLLAGKCFTAFYPLHEEEDLKQVSKQWLGFKPRVDFYRDTGISLCGGKPDPYRYTSPRLDLLKEYFGEKIALYAAFVQHLIIWMFIPAMLGIYMYGRAESQLVQSMAVTNETMMKLMDNLCIDTSSGRNGAFVTNGRYTSWRPGLNTTSNETLPQFDGYSKLCWVNTTAFQEAILAENSIYQNRSMKVMDDDDKLSFNAKLKSCKVVEAPYQIVYRPFMATGGIDNSWSSGKATPEQAAGVVAEQLGCVQSPDTLWYDVPELPFYGLLIALWSTAILDYWRRKQNIYAMEWGMTDYEETEVLRSEYINNPITKNIVDPVSGEVAPYFPANEYIKRHGMSKTTIITFTLAIVAVVAGVVVFRAYMAYMTSFRPESFPEWIRFATPYFGALLNTVQITIFGMIWKKVAKKLNDLENHPTFTAYEDSLILKTFIFQFINNFASLIYICIQPYFSICVGAAGDDPLWKNCSPGQRSSGNDGGPYEGYICAAKPENYCRENLCVGPGGCIGLLSKQLLVIFLSRVLLSNIGEVKGVVITLLQPLLFLLPCLKKSKPAEGDEPSKAEVAFLKKPYTKDDQISDYLELVLTFGYISFFVVAWPLSPAIAFVNNFLEIRLDMSKLCIERRRPPPRGAEDIGRWEDILEFMGYFSLFSNMIIIIFHGHFSWIELQYSSKLIMFIIAEHALILSKWGFGYFIGE